MGEAASLSEGDVREGERGGLIREVFQGIEGVQGPRFQEDIRLQVVQGNQQVVAGVKLVRQFRL